MERVTVKMCLKYWFYGPFKNYAETIIKQKKAKTGAPGRDKRLLSHIIFMQGLYLSGKVEQDKTVLCKFNNVQTTDP